TLTHVDFTPLQASIIALALTGSGYSTEIIRSGIQAVDTGHVEAGLSLGLNRLVIYRDIVLPQAIRITIPPLGNLFIGLLKGATVVSVISVTDMVWLAVEINVTYFRPFEAFTAVGVILVCLVATFALVLGAL